jgi:tubulin polyglutamylase TTLL6/13
MLHLTNYAINKKSKKFIFNTNKEDDNIGHKRSMIAVFKTLEEEGHDIKTLWREIKKTIIKTMCVG